MPDILLSPIITDCKTSSDRCTNCKRFDPQNNHCKMRQVVIESPANTTCKHWRDVTDDKLTCSLNPDPHGTCWECPIDCQRWKDMVREVTAPLQADGSLKVGSSETIGATVVNADSVTKTHLGNNKQPVFGKTSLKEIEDRLAKEQQKRTRDQEARILTIALDRGVQQGHTLEALDTVFDIACQQVPSCKERWMLLKEHIQGMLINKWAKENEDSFRAEY